ncbi:MAG: hypothetical protein LBK58_02710 [Prevotellaceae bacterium]|nr:hypothetical protein [Prevotellaceae bacterium]
MSIRIDDETTLCFNSHFSLRK